MRVKEHILALAVCLLGLAACTNNNPPEVGAPVDPRDAFVGTYDYTSTGNLDIYLAGTKVYSFPLNKNGSFDIVKEEAESKVAIVGAIIGERDSIHAVVTGNQLELENNSASYTENGLAIQIELDYDKATLTGNQLVWAADMMGIGTYQSYSINGSGHIAVSATKQ